MPITAQPGAIPLKVDGEAFIFLARSHGFWPYQLEVWAAHHHKGCGVAREDDVAKRGDVTRARGVAKRRAVAKDQVASGGTIQVDDVAKGDGDVEAVKADLTQADDVTNGTEVTEVKPDMTQGDNMTEVSGHSKAGETQLAATTTANPCATILQAIVAEATEYSKKSIDDRLTFVEKLLGAKSLETMIRIQSDYAKTSHEDFVAQTKKMGELYSDLTKAAFKPFEVANVQGTKQ
jgi:hypothetical protein